MLEVTELESSEKLYKTRVQVRDGDLLEERQVRLALRLAQNPAHKSVTPTLSSQISGLTASAYATQTGLARVPCRCGKGAMVRHANARQRSTTHDERDPVRVH